MINLILLERIERLGQIGDVVTVKPGFARNYLLPQKKALRATKENLKQFDERKAQLLADNLKRRDEAQTVAAKMTGLKVALVRQAGESGQLYGSVTGRDLAEAVTAQGFTINKAQVVIEHPIKTIGVHQVRVALHPEVSVGVAVAVAQSLEEGKAALANISSAREEAPADAGEDAETETESAA